MYITYTPDDWRSYMRLPHDYTVEGIIVFGSNESYGYAAFRDALERNDATWRARRLDGEYLQPILEWVVGGKCFWFVVAYGSAQLSEFLHIGCMLGSTMNILIGNCGGLALGMQSLDIIVPTSSYATESAAAMYQPNAGNVFVSNSSLSDALAASLSGEHTVYRDTMITCQAMFAESDEHIDQWVRDGYVGVEMEAATVFAVSKHFNVPAAAVLKVIDNLGKHETILENGYHPADATHESTLADMFDTALAHMIVDK